MDQAILRIGAILDSPETERATLFFANAHTLNLAFGDTRFRSALCSADMVFGDGTGVRWAAKWRGLPMCDNVNGTDLTPRLLATAGPRRRSYFLLGADASTIEKAAHRAASDFPDWDQVGFHHGYLSSPQSTDALIDRINQAAPDLLLVGMGNPLQELWIHRYRARIRAKVCMGVGGLFDFWSGNVSR